ncbi:MAG: hypothetical protein AAFQ09_09520 [Pseudomonadota bacterium]
MLSTALFYLTGIIFAAILLMLSLSRIAVTPFWRDNNSAMGVLYAAGLGRWFPKGVSYSLAWLRAFGGWLWGPKRSFAVERITGFNTLIFLRSVGQVDRMLRAGRQKMFHPGSVGDGVAACDVVLFWHTYDYIYHLNDLLHETQHDTRPILIVRRFPHPKFQAFVTRLCQAYGREVLFVLKREDLLAVRASGQHRRAVWLVGAEFFYRKRGSAFKAFQRKVLRSRAVCVHTPWPDCTQNWHLCTDIANMAEDHLRAAQRFYGKAMIWPHGLIYDRDGTGDLSN